MCIPLRSFVPSQFLFFAGFYARNTCKKCFCCAYAHKIALYVSKFFMFYYAFMFYARIKWPPDPNFLCAHKTYAYKHKTKKCLRGTCVLRVPVFLRLSSLQQITAALIVDIRLGPTLLLFIAAEHGSTFSLWCFRFWCQFQC